MREVETTLEVPDRFGIPDLLGVKGVASRSIMSWSLRAQYWDTEDLVLARQGVTLRRRTGEGEVTWTAKLPTATSTGRWEVDVLSRAGRPPARLQKLVRPWAGAGSLQVVVEIRTERVSTLLVSADGDALVEVADDAVTASGGDAASWREVEVEVVGSPETAERVVRALRRAGAWRSRQPSKARRALGVPEERAPVVRPRDPASLLVMRVLADGRRGILLRDTEVRMDQPDGVHQLRVSCRRLRSELQTLAPLLADPRVDRVREELRWLGGELSAARDLEVLRERLAATAGDGPEPLDVSALDAVLATHEADAMATARAALASARYERLLADLRELQRAPVFHESAHAACRDVLPRLGSKADRRLASALGELASDAPDDVWHSARKRAKRARYVSETLAAVLPAHKRAKRAKALQQLLGEHTDAVLASERLLQIAAEHPELSVVCARLAERESGKARAVRSRVLARR